MSRSANYGSYKEDLYIENGYNEWCIKYEDRKYKTCYRKECRLDSIRALVREKLESLEVINDNEYWRNWVEWQGITDEIKFEYRTLLSKMGVEHIFKNPRDFNYSKVSKPT